MSITILALLQADNHPIPHQTHPRQGNRCCLRRNKGGDAIFGLHRGTFTKMTSLVATQYIFYLTSPPSLHYNTHITNLARSGQNEKNPSHHPKHNHRLRPHVRRILPRQKTLRTFPTIRRNRSRTNPHPLQPHRLSPHHQPARTPHIVSPRRTSSPNRIRRHPPR